MVENSATAGITALGGAEFISAPLASVVGLCPYALRCGDKMSLCDLVICSSAALYASVSLIRGKAKPSSLNVSLIRETSKRNPFTSSPIREKSKRNPFTSSLIREESKRNPFTTPLIRGVVNGNWSRLPLIRGRPRRNALASVPEGSEGNEDQWNVTL